MKPWEMNKESLPKFGGGSVVNTSLGSGKVVLEKGSKQSSSGPSVVPCREDEEGGGWTMVTRRKTGHPQKKQLGKERGFHPAEKWRFGEKHGEKGKGGAANPVKSGRKPVLVYKRGGKVANPLSSSLAAVQDAGPAAGSDASAVTAREAQQGGRLKRPIGGYKEGDGIKEREGGVLIEGEEGQVADGALVVFIPASPCSPMEEVEVIKKRRKGGEDSLCGGDTSPLVIS